MKLLSPRGDVRGQKVLVTAAFAGLDLETPPFVIGKDDLTESFKAMSPLLRFPVLETDTGSCISESAAICRYLARVRNDKFLYGETFQESADVDMWLDFCTNDLEVPILSWVLIGPAGATKAQIVITNALKAMDNHLKLKTFMASERITVADICIAVVLCFGQKKLSADLLNAYPHVLRWNETVSNQKSFTKSCPQCVWTTTITTTTDKETDDDAEDSAPPPKPKKCELDFLPATSFDLNEWKRKYSNTKDLRGVAMPWLWANLDPSGYCFYHMKYDKLDGECTVAFTTSNQLGGFLQRTNNDLHRYAFGVINVVGKDSCFHIKGVWMFRGSEIPNLMKEHPSFEYNTWTKLDHSNVKDKAIIEDYFCNEDTVEGLPIANSKVWK